MASTSAALSTHQLAARGRVAQRVKTSGKGAIKAASRSGSAAATRCEVDRVQMGPATRREALLALAAAPALGSMAVADPAWAVQGLTAGRIPGVSPSEVNGEGWNFYRRPDGKSGGHGVGWSEIPPYSFEVPDQWEEKPVSIADLGGAEVDLRFSCQPEGDLAVVVAPVLRFYDVGYNASVTIEEIAKPEAVIKAFAPELIGRSIEEDDITRIETVKYPDSNLTYYIYDLKPHFLIAATAFKNRLFVMTVRSSSVQWRKSAAKLQIVRDSFRVSTA